LAGRRPPDRVARERRACADDRPGRIRIRGTVRRRTLRQARRRVSIDIATFGCRLNAYESEVIRANVAAAGLDDVVVVYTLAVSAEAGRQARQAIRTHRRAHPAARLVVTGGAAPTRPQA